MADYKAKKHYDLNLLWLPKYYYQHLEFGCLYKEYNVHNSEECMCLDMLQYASEYAKLKSHNRPSRPGPMSVIYEC